MPADTTTPPDRGWPGPATDLGVAVAAPDPGRGEPAPRRPVVRLAAVRDTALSVDEVLAAVRDPAAGGVCVFVGVVRDEDHGRAVTALGYSAHPSSAAVLADIAARVAAPLPVTAVAAVHRIGDLAVGDLAVVVAASAPHREHAFVAARRLIDELKATAPIWKHQRFLDGGDEWVGTP